MQHRYVNLTHKSYMYHVKSQTKVNIEGRRLGCLTGHQVTGDSRFVVPNSHSIANDFSNKFLLLVVAGDNLFRLLP